MQGPDDASQQNPQIGEPGRRPDRCGDRGAGDDRLYHLRSDRPLCLGRLPPVGREKARRADRADQEAERSEEHTSELQSLMRISYAVFCLKKKKQKYTNKSTE